MLPMVRYTGYMTLPRKSVSCILLDEMITGTTVAPGHHLSRDV
jgi:hypothetical protein